MAIHVRPLSIEAAMKDWHTYGRMLEPALEYNAVAPLTTVEHWRQRVEEGDAGCFIVWDDETSQILVCFLLSMERMPSGAHVMDIPALGGQDVETWITQVWQFICTLARDAGCIQVRFAGRAGWQKFIGVRPASVNYVQELEPVEEEEALIHA